MVRQYRGIAARYLMEGRKAGKAGKASRVERIQPICRHMAHPTGAGQRPVTLTLAGINKVPHRLLFSARRLGKETHAGPLCMRIEHVSVGATVELWRFVFIDFESAVALSFILFQ